MSWAILAAMAGVLTLAVLVALHRRAEIRAMARTLERRDVAVEQGAAKAELQHPVIDLSRCLGCGTCVAACPEEGVLEMVHGQAAVVRGARCIGAGACERECPVDAITITMGDTSERRDIPALDPHLEAVGTPGLFLAGEVTAHALIKTAIDHGVAVAAEVATRMNGSAGQDTAVLDLCIVGAGPAGLAASLEAKRHGLSFLTIDQEARPGGTVARYPRRKLVTTQPIEIPLYGKFRQTSYSKEELMELWHGIIDEQQLPIQGNETFERLSRSDDGAFIVHTGTQEIRARHVCLALGRRGAPRRLGIPGEELPKVAYSLLDARSYAGRQVMVIGGGDSAVEAAIALSEQVGTEVALSYRRAAFIRIKAVNERRLQDALSEGRLTLYFETTAVAIDETSVTLQDAAGQRYALPNQDVFIMVGGIAPVDVLEAAGVSFDPSLRAASEAIEEEGTGLVHALATALALTLLALAFAVYHGDYYGLPRFERPAHIKHELLRPGRGLGLWLGIGSITLVAVNLAYLVRRAPAFAAKFAGWPIGSLKAWMTSHIATGILAFLFALLHASMAPRNTVGSHALWALLALLVTGSIGRYLYAWVPRAANGRELEIDEVKFQLSALSGAWDGQHQAFGAEAREKLGELVRTRQWESSFLGRIGAMLTGHRALKSALVELHSSGTKQGLSRDQIDGVLKLTERGYHTALHAAHLEDIRAVLGTWRYAHRWVAALMVVLALLHIGHAIFYGQLIGGRS
ncbi:Ferredoxin--NADP reductase [Planctomycetes bacterium Poly30]|uniref:Ferredoxin--NADP reductase n=1 Tax=Saltatorellus ferox TaxID=2528018 RepID=A0A518ENV4_9BACT|nr:Ferredoxin--NADP reductase [Planctomycetes bacterium Poly30]